MSNYYVAIDKDGNYILAHAGKWRQHKYIRKEGNRYIYPEDLRRGRATDAVTNGARGGGPNKIDSNPYAQYKTDNALFRKSYRPGTDRKKYTRVSTIHNKDSSALAIARESRYSVSKGLKRSSNAEYDRQRREEGMETDAHFIKTWSIPLRGSQRVLSESVHGKQALSASSKGKSIVDSIKSFGSSVVKAASSAVAKGKSILDSIFKRPTATSATKKGLRK